MHILFLNARYRPEGIAGPAFTTQYLAEQLVREGFRASVVCRTERPGIHDETLAGVRVVRIGFDVPTAGALECVAGMLDRFQPDVLHTLFPREFPLDRIAALARARGIAVVHTLLAFFLLCPQGSLMRGGRVCEVQCADCHAATAQQRDFADQVDAVVGMSCYMLDLHRDWGLFRNTPIQRVIKNAYQPPHEVTPSPVTTPLRLGYLGRLDPLKGVDYLLRTLSGDLAHRSWTLILGGRGEPAYEQRLRALYTDPRIRFLGFVQAAEFLSQVDVLVVPSLLQEPFGRVLIEAYGHGVTVIGARRGGIPEVIEDGQTGLIFDPDAVDGPLSLAATIESLLDAPERLAAMKRHALVKWRQDFTPEKILADYREIYAAVSKT
jgi:glycosyltransferase involved in cell wall biosynthesis